MLLIVGHMLLNNLIYRRWNSYDRIQYSEWSYALVCLFRPLLLEAPIENQQDQRIAHTEKIRLCASIPKANPTTTIAFHKA